MHLLKSIITKEQAESLNAHILLDITQLGLMRFEKVHKENGKKKSTSYHQK